MNAVFRSAGPGDLETLLPFVREFWVLERLAFVEPAVRRALAGILATPDFGRVVAIELESLPVGYYVLTLGYSLEHLGRDAFVDELYLREPQRGKGIGARALAHAAELCAQLGVGALHLEVDHVNPRARALYERNGFAAHERALMTRKVARG
ncbi:MAG TPA: GNAT family N-acetyltransferase [Myxococcota bacterium]|nr:GNAT family N-acetyltransferase [Myxococcota bacterium]